MDLLALRMDLFNTLWYCCVDMGLCQTEHINIGEVCSQICHTSPQPCAFSANINWYSAMVFSSHGWLNIHMRCDMTNGTSMAIRALVCHRYHKFWLADIKVLSNLMRGKVQIAAMHNNYNPMTHKINKFYKWLIQKYWFNLNVCNSRENERLPLRQPNRMVDLVYSATEEIKCLPTLMVLPITK